MACFWNFYKEYLEKVSEKKKWIIDFKTKKENVSVKVICNQKNIDVNEQVEYFNFKNYGFNNFFIRKIPSIKPYYGSTYLFLVSIKKNE